MCDVGYMHFLIQSSNNSEVNSLIIPVFYMQALRLREVILRGKQNNGIGSLVTMPHCLPLLLNTSNELINPPGKMPKKS